MFSSFICGRITPKNPAPCTPNVLDVPTPMVKVADWLRVLVMSEELLPKFTWPKLSNMYNLVVSYWSSTQWLVLNVGVSLAKSMLHGSGWWRTGKAVGTDHTGHMAFSARILIYFRFKETVSTKNYCPRKFPNESFRNFRRLLAQLHKFT